MKTNTQLECSVFTQDGSASGYNDYLYMAARSCLFAFDGDDFYHILDSLGEKSAQINSSIQNFTGLSAASFSRAAQLRSGVFCIH